MTVRTISYCIALALAVFACPPMMVSARQFAQIMSATDRGVGAMAAAHELYAAAETGRRWKQSNRTMHSIKYPAFLACDFRRSDHENPAVAESLDLAFFADSDWRQQIAIETHLSRSLSSVALAALTGCVEASAVASHCATWVYKLGAHAPPMEGSKFSDARRAAAYCAGVKGLSWRGQQS